MNWIKCSERMPPKDVQVLAFGPFRGELVGGAKMDICVWDGLKWWDEGGTEQSLELTATGWGDPCWTHWMPLPEPPNVDDDIRMDGEDMMPLEISND